MDLNNLAQLTQTQQWDYLHTHETVDAAKQRVCLLPDGTCIFRHYLPGAGSKSGKTRSYVICWATSDLKYAIAREKQTGPGWHGGYGRGVWRFVRPPLDELCAEESFSDMEFNPLPPAPDLDEW